MSAPVTLISPAYVRLEFELLRLFGNESARGGRTYRGELPENRWLNSTVIRPFDANIPVFTWKQAEPGPDEEGASLPGMTGGDYYNASMVMLRRAIAAQAPSTPRMMRVFNAMVDQTEVTTIVTLTNAIGRGREKCHDYWSGVDGEVLFENGIQKIVKRTLTLDGVSREITHYHFENWPDGGVVEAKVLKKLIKAVGAVTGPLLVHCLAGVGRTGTFLAAYEAYIDQEGDVRKIVFRNRSYGAGRMRMVQNPDQLGLIYKTVYLLLSSKTHEVSGADAAAGAGAGTAG